MKKHQTCPQCGSELEIVFRPTNSFFNKIGLDNGMFCSSCIARISITIRNSYLALAFYIPYIALQSWNVFVAQYGMEHYGLEKVDNYWLFIAICILIVGVFILARNKVYVLHKNPSNNQFN
ncbi:MAG: hypothetical protein ABFS02_09090 [Pseudomonadota bacterium]